MVHRSMLFQLVVLIVALLAVTVSQNIENSCETIGQDKCLFVVSTGRSGSTALMNTLNSLPNVFVRGENGGVFYLVESLHNFIEGMSNHKFSVKDELQFYRQYSANHKPAHFNFFPNNTAHCMAQSVFKQMYGYQQYDSYRVGFKEIRFGPQQSFPVKYNVGLETSTGLRPQLRSQKNSVDIFCKSYEDFKNRVMFLFGLCKDPLAIFNMRKDIETLRQSGWFKNRSDAKIQAVEEYMQWLKQFNTDFPSESLLVYYEDMFDSNTNQTVLDQLMDFLNVERNPQASFVSSWRMQ